MKRLTAILFLCLLIFNLYGYRLMLSYLENQADLSLEQRLENKLYSDKDLITIKIPTSLPYYTNSTDFERVDGEVAIEGVLYKYVKRRIYNDSLELLCIPHPDKTRWQMAKDEFAKMNSDAALPQQNKKGSTSDLKINLPEYCQLITQYQFNLQAETCTQCYLNYTAFLNKGVSTRIDQPPEMNPA
ncbi:MAG: hypothetical protein ICV51_00890 [Flavisolibacter sp.]|nr:hypothetical protein [Flavisolibacter sp.]